MITHSTTLTHDLLDCPGIGLEIGANDVTLDLGGHVVDGDGNGDAAGVEAVGRAHVVVRNGAVRDFVEGVAAVRVAGVRIDGIDVDRSRHVGLFAVDSERVVIANSSARGTTYAGIFVARSKGVVIGHDVARGNGAGIAVRASHGVRIVSNVVMDNGFAGLEVDTHLAVVTGNVLSRNGDGIIVHGNRARISDNRITDAVGCLGVGDRCVSPPPGPCPACEEGYGITVEGGSGTVLSGNRVARTRLDAIRVAAFDPHLPTNATVVRDNAVSAAAMSGILVSLDGEGHLGWTLLRSNRVVGSGRDGVDVEARTTMITTTVANDNAELGIRAVRGVRDGGGNRARGNGDPRQCVNVMCGP